MRCQTEQKAGVPCVPVRKPGRKGGSIKHVTVVSLAPDGNVSTVRYTWYFRTTAEGTTLLILPVPDSTVRARRVQSFVRFCISICPSARPSYALTRIRYPSRKTLTNIDAAPRAKQSKNRGRPREESKVVVSYLTKAYFKLADGTRSRVPAEWQRA